jgi:multisubunit Na+/H+ antiporter MnhF subunit
MFVDISLAYGLTGFIGVLGLAKYFEQKEAEHP